MAQLWQDSEVQELLLIRGEEETRLRATRTARDDILCTKIAARLRTRGIARAPRQVVKKLKELESTYLSITEQKRGRTRLILLSRLPRCGGV